MIDIDEFKPYNDSKGHQAGDECLKLVAGEIEKATINTHCLSARYGGEKFAVVLPGIGERDAIMIAQSIRLSIKAMAIDHPDSARGIVSISIGVAAKQGSADNSAELIERADGALYEAERLERDRVIASSVVGTSSARKPAG